MQGKNLILNIFKMFVNAHSSCTENPRVMNSFREWWIKHFKTVDVPFVEKKKEKSIFSSPIFIITKSDLNFALKKNAFSRWTRLNSSHIMQTKRLRFVYFEERIFHSIETSYPDTKTRSSKWKKHFINWSSFWR